MRRSGTGCGLRQSRLREKVEDAGALWIRSLRVVADVNGDGPAAAATQGLVFAGTAGRRRGGLVATKLGKGRWVLSMLAQLIDARDGRREEAAGRQLTGAFGGDQQVSGGAAVNAKELH